MVWPYTIGGGTTPGAERSSSTFFNALAQRAQSEVIIGAATSNGLVSGFAAIARTTGCVSHASRPRVSSDMFGFAVLVAALLVYISTSGALGAPVPEIRAENAPVDICDGDITWDPYTAGVDW